MIAVVDARIGGIRGGDRRREPPTRSTFLFLWSEERAYSIAGRCPLTGNALARGVLQRDAGQRRGTDLERPATRLPESDSKRRRHRTFQTEL